MTPPVFVHPLPASAVPGSEIVLDGPEGRHAARVMRVTAGETVVLVDGAGRRAHGTVVGVGSVAGGSPAQVTIGVDAVTDEPEPAPRISVVQALPKGDRGELAVELLTEIGVDAIVPWSARHCVTQWRGDRAERSWRKWQEAAIAAGKQARRSRFPTVEPLATTTQVVDLVRQADLALMLHEEGSTPIGQVDLPDAGDVVIIVGPEGGLAPDEREALGAAGAREVVLGPSVLRTSSAGMAAAAALLARSVRWDARMKP